MDKWIIRVVCLLLAMLLLVGLVAPALADEVEETVPEETVAQETMPEETVPPVELTIGSVEDFLKLAEDCRIDSYSENLYVILEADIDLSGVEFESVPIFCGIFAGNGHTISGVKLIGDGSNAGLFRYLTATATVQNLTVMGTVAPTGSRENVGGIAGSNAGRIVNCVFSGTVSGSGYVGGLVGINTVSGVIEGCKTEGTVSGNHYVGGLVGENGGNIYDCVNSAQVNTTVKENSVEISDITVETLLGTESAATVTDIGGIAGTSSGMILNCVNRGSVGYKHMGYNIGGIAGSLTGYVSGCINYDPISGRKEVGGIVGQLEPYTVLRYETDTVQILRSQMEILSGLIDKATSNAQGNLSYINNLLNNLQNYVYRAEKALNSLTDTDNLSLDTISSVAQELQNCISGIGSTMRSLTYAISSTTGTLTKDLEAVSEQMDVITAILEGAEENLGGTMADISDRDTDGDMTAKIEDSRNYGAVLADINVGGIVGAIALENDLDPESDVEVRGDSSLNMATEMRAVVRDCGNSGTVTAKKRNAGGIAGWMSMGLVRDCVSTGTMDSEGADYVGGIAGRSDGYIRDCSARAAITGSTRVGGVAGQGTVVTGCRSMTVISGASEQAGAVLGQMAENWTDEARPISGNRYLSAGSDIGAIDGISYAGQAEPMEQEDFLALEGAAEIFGTVTVSFVFEDGTVQTVSMAPGTVLTEKDIPALPAVDGFAASWEGLPEVGVEEVLFDITIHAKYTGYDMTIRSDAARDNGLPVVLAEGSFEKGAAVSISASLDTPALAEGQKLEEVWQFEISGGTADRLRYRLPDDVDAGGVCLLVRTARGPWKTVDFTVDGSYIVFAVSSESDAFAVISQIQVLPMEIIIAAAVSGFVVIAAGVILLLRKRRKKGK